MSNRRERDMTNEKLQAILADMLKDEDNKYCADCDAKGPRWASWNLGIFLCIRCAGIHRNLGVHISRVKSVNLDTWTPGQIAMMREIGNSRGRAIYEANIPDNFRRPQNDMAVEQLIRSKYEEKRYQAKGWVPPSPESLTLASTDEKRTTGGGRRRAAGKPVVDLTRAPAGNAAVPRPNANGQVRQAASGSVIRRAAEASESPATSVASPPQTSHTEDLLGLSDDSAQAKKASAVNGASDDLFGEFLSSNPPASSTSADNLFASPASVNQGPSSLEQDLFGVGVGQPCQPSEVPSQSEKNEPPKSTKESILALYGSQPSLASVPPPSVPNQFLGMPSQVSMRGCHVMQNFVAYPSNADVPVYGVLHASASAPHMGSLGFNAQVNGSSSAMMGFPAAPSGQGFVWGQPPYQQAAPQPPPQQSFFGNNMNGPAGQSGMFGVQHNPFFAQQQAQMQQQQQQQQQQLYLQQVQQQLSGLQLGHPAQPAAATTAPPEGGQTLATNLWQ